MKQFISIFSILFILSTCSKDGGSNGADQVDTGEGTKDPSGVYASVGWQFKGRVYDPEPTSAFKGITIRSIEKRGGNYCAIYSIVNNPVPPFDAFSVISNPNEFIVKENLQLKGDRLLNATDQKRLGNHFLWEDDGSLTDNYIVSRGSFHHINLYTKANDEATRMKFESQGFKDYIGKITDNKASFYYQPGQGKQTGRLTMTVLRGGTWVQQDLFGGPSFFDLSPRCKNWDKIVYCLGVKGSHDYLAVNATENGTPYLLLFKGNINTGELTLLDSVTNTSVTEMIVNRENPDNPFLISTDKVYIVDNNKVITKATGVILDGITTTAGYRGMLSVPFAVHQNTLYRVAYNSGVPTNRYAIQKLSGSAWVSETIPDFTTQNPDGYMDARYINSSDAGLIIGYEGHYGEANVNNSKRASVMDIVLKPR